MVDDEFDRHEWIDLGRVAAKCRHGVSHGGEIDHAGHAREILHQHAGGGEGDLGIGFSGRVPLGEGFDVFSHHREAVFATKEIFK